jgi:hypothetical protein
VSRRPPAGAAALALALALAACTATSSGSTRLTVAGPRWVLHGFDAPLDVRVSGALAEHDVLLVVAVGSKSVDRVGTVDGRVRVVVPAAKLAVGPNLISVKTGSERRELVVQVVPLACAAVPAVLVIGALAAVRWRRSVRRSR